MARASIYSGCWDECMSPLSWSLMHLRKDGLVLFGPLGDDFCTGVLGLVGNPVQTSYYLKAHGT